ncbi:MAG: hypothetical protein AVDCRST_MAG69-1997 [uncultured Solirubrobacteraceae bacterium]|uniref:Uncharacterized protein n=1 Tax=uncultured Solirubrobacteraceae bacterium TaxID=1162706 RepID=A0A6J4SQZ6_9ACTN|nr:MAG: hypothetical protein AVDCRST_MAG69-1997 [uncultured Solirubrobacteraceae bacterium]
MLSTLLVVAMVALVAAMVAEQLRQHRRRKRELRSLLDEVTGVLEDGRRDLDASGLPFLEGRHAGHDARLDLVIDALALRKLPRLFLRAAIHRPLPVAAPVFAVRMTTGSGMVENDRRLSRGMPTPPDWPEDVLVRTTENGPVPMPGPLLELGRLFEDPRTSSVMVSSRGVRVSWEAARGDVAAWRVSRGARFGTCVPAALAHELLEVTAGVADEVAGPVTKRSGRHR